MLHHSNPHPDIWTRHGPPAPPPQREHLAPDFSLFHAGDVGDSQGDQEI